MASKNYTPNYGLTQYSDNGYDRVETGDLNHDNLVIDLKFKALEDRIRNLESQSNGAN